MSAEPTGTLDQLVALFGITPRRIQQLAAEGIIPRTAHGEYPLWSTIRAYIAHLRGATSHGDGPDPRTERALLSRTQRLRLELEIARTKGQLIPAAEVERTFSDMLKIVVAGLETLPDVLERDTGIGPRAVARATEVIDGLREELHAQLAGETHT